MHNSSITKHTCLRVLCFDFLWRTYYETTVEKALSYSMRDLNKLEVHVVEKNAKLGYEKASSHSE